MSRTSRDIYVGLRLWNGFDYANQAWAEDGRYQSCAHPETMKCGCYGRTHAGEETQAPGNPSQEFILHAGLNQSRSL